MPVGDNWLVGPEDWSTGMKDTFLRWGAPDNAIMGYPKLSKEILEVNRPNWRVRQYVGSVNDFSRGASDYILITRFKNAYTEEWQELSDEFSDVPQIRMGWTRFSARVKEYGVAIPITERLTHFSTFNVEQIARTYLSDIVRNSIDRQIFKNAVLWADFVVAITEAGVEKVKGKAVGDPQSRVANMPKSFSGSDPSAPAITINLVNFVGDFQFKTPGRKPRPIQAQHLLEIRAELIRRRMRARTNALLCNTVFEQELLRDTNLQTFFAFARSSAVATADLGPVYSFEVVVDDTGILDEVVDSINALPNPADPTVSLTGDEQVRGIAILFGEDGFRELIALPETVRTDVPVSFGRFNRIGAITYRGETPMWFYSDTEAYRNPTTGTLHPE
ncbi:MAG: phage major capsid protein, partial [candidate division WOR-3 bacterium]